MCIQNSSQHLAPCYAQAEANTTGAFIIIMNSLYVVLLVFMFYKHMRDVIAHGFLNVRSTTGKVMTAAWKRSMVATRNLRSMKTVRALRGMSTMLKRSKKDKSMAGEQSLDKDAANRAQSLTQPGPAEVYALDSPAEVYAPDSPAGHSPAKRTASAKGEPGGQPVHAST